MPEISIILPCLNEEEALEICLNEINDVIRSKRLNAEIVVVDNGSTDRSLEIAEKMKASIPELRLFKEPRRGYGAAYMRGLSEARGKYFFMADADHSYDFADIPTFIDKLKSGADLVVGNRFTGTIENGAMPLHHRYLGNPFLSFLVKKLFKIKIKDIHCGMRAITRSGWQKITLYTAGMEFASEMIVKAGKQHLSVAEIPVHYRRRIGTSKLQSLGDGWRHLRFILLYSPIYLFFIPGATFSASASSPCSSFISVKPPFLTFNSTFTQCFSHQSLSCSATKSSFSPAFRASTQSPTSAKPTTSWNPSSKNHHRKSRFSWPICCMYWSFHLSRHFYTMDSL